MDLFQQAAALRRPQTVHGSRGSGVAPAREAVSFSPAEGGHRRSQDVLFSEVRKEAFSGKAPSGGLSGVSVGMKRPESAPQGGSRQQREDADAKLLKSLREKPLEKIWLESHLASRSGSGKGDTNVRAILKSTFFPTKQVSSRQRRKGRAKTVVPHEPDTCVFCSSKCRVSYHSRWCQACKMRKCNYCGLTSMADDLRAERCGFCMVLGNSCAARMPMKRLGLLLLKRRPDLTTQQLLDILTNYGESDAECLRVMKDLDSDPMVQGLKTEVAVLKQTAEHLMALVPVGLDEANEQLKDMIAILKKQNQELQTQLNMVTVESDKNMSAMNILKKEKDDLERYLQDFKEQLTRIRGESHPELAAELTSHLREADQHVGKLNEAVIEISNQLSTQVTMLNDLKSTIKSTIKEGVQSESNLTHRAVLINSLVPANLSQTLHRASSSLSTTMTTTTSSANSGGAGGLTRSRSVDVIDESVEEEGEEGNAGLRPGGALFICPRCHGNMVPAGPASLKSSGEMGSSMEDKAFQTPRLDGTSEAVNPSAPPTPPGVASGSGSPLNASSSASMSGSTDGRRKRKKGGGRLPSYHGPLTRSFLSANPKDVYTPGETLNVIYDLFEKKAIADSVDERENNAKDTVPEFLEEYLLHLHGPQMGKKRLGKVLHSALALVQSSGEYPLIECFLALLGIKQPNLYTPEAGTMFFQLLRRLMPNYKAIKEQLSSDTSQRPHVVTWRDAVHAIIGPQGDRRDPKTWDNASLLAVVSKKDVGQLLDEIDLKKLDEEGPGNKRKALESKVRVRDVLKIALETYLSRIAQEERWLQSAMAQQYPIFKNVTFADFEKFATSVAINTQSLSQKQLQGIYRQMLRSEGDGDGDMDDKDTFLRICLQLGIFARDHVSYLAEKL